MSPAPTRRISRTRESAIGGQGAASVLSIIPISFLIFNCKYYTEFRFEIKCAANAPRFRWGRCSSPQCYRAPRDSRRRICRVTYRRGETPHLLESSLIAICDRAATANGTMKLRRFTKRLRYRCGRCFANFNRPHPTRQGGLFHGDAARRRNHDVASSSLSHAQAWAVFSRSVAERRNPLRLQPVLHGQTSLRSRPLRASA